MRTQRTIDRDINIFLFLFASVMALIFFAAVSWPQDCTLDYAIDIKDNGTGTVQLVDIKTGIRYVVPFDSVEETIIKLNE